MRKLMWLAVIVALGALPLSAAQKGRPGGQKNPSAKQGGPGPQQGQPPDGGQDDGFGDKQGGPGQPPGPPPDGGQDDGFGDKRGGPGRPPGPPPGPPPDGGFGMPPGPPPGPPPGGPGGGPPDAAGRTELFEAAKQTLTLPSEARKGIDQLDAQFRDDLQAAVAEARLKLSKDYVAKVLALLPDDQKPKYQAVAKALSERDEAVAAAQKALKAALAQAKTSQGADQAPRADRGPRGGPPGGSQISKVDILRTHFVLTDEQRQALDQAQRESFDDMRKRTRALFDGLKMHGGPQDPDAFRRVAQAMARIRDEVDDSVAKTAAEFLTDDQKKDYATACAAIDAFRAKAKEAEEACRKKIQDAVGQAKASRLLGPPPGTLAEPKKGTTF